MIKFLLNSEHVEFKGDSETPLLWVIRDQYHLTGTKFGCGIGQCGACTVHMNGQAIRSCLYPVKAVENAKIRTIEHIADGNQLHPVQEAWVQEDVAQCGYCQAGQIMTVIDLLNTNPNPSNDEIKKKITNICRCGTYARMKKAIQLASKLIQQGKTNE